MKNSLSVRVSVIEAGVDLKKLLVVRPPYEALTRVAVRLAEANAFSVLVIDTVGCLEQLNSRQVHGNQHWVRAVRRLALAIQDTHTQVFMLTDKNKPRSMPWPVAQRIELSRKSLDKLEVKVTKDKRGRISEGREVQLSSYFRTVSPAPVQQLFKTKLFKTRRASL